HSVDALDPGDVVRLDRAQRGLAGAAGGEHGRGPVPGVVEAEGVPVLVRGHALDVPAVGDAAGAVVPDPLVAEGDAPAVGDGRLREGQRSTASAVRRPRDDVVVDASRSVRVAGPEGVEVGSAAAELVAADRVTAAVAVQPAAP